MAIITTNNPHFIMDSIVDSYSEAFIKNFPKIVQHIAIYIDKASNVLQTLNVGERLLYTQSIENSLYDAAGVDKSDIITIVNTSTNLDKKIQNQVNPLYNFLMVLSCFYEQKKDEIKKLYKFKGDPALYVRFYLVLRIYSISQKQIFKYTPRADIMEYTINHLSNRYDLPKFDNIYSWLWDYMVTNNKSLDADLNYIADGDIYQWNSKMINRIKSVLKYIYRAFDENYRKNKSIVEENIQATNKEDGNDYYVITTSISNQIEIFSKNVQQQFIQDREIRDNLIAIACKNNHCSPSKLKYILTEMKSDQNDNQLLLDIIMNLISFWVISGKQKVENIHSMAFIKRCIGAYSISNTYDPFIKSLKNNLSTVVERYGQKYVDIDKKTTVNVFKQSLFLYMVFYISSIQ